MNEQRLVTSNDLQVTSNDSSLAMSNETHFCQSSSSYITVLGNVTGHTPSTPKL